MRISEEIQLLITYAGMIDWSIFSIMVVFNILVWVVMMWFFRLFWVTNISNDLRVMSQDNIKLKQMVIDLGSNRDQSRGNHQRTDKKP